MYYEKYKKYKSKYLALKNNINKIGGSDPDLQRAIEASLQDFNEDILEVSDRVLNVIPNSGMIDGMSQQCFWISIFNYLERHPAANTLNVTNVRDLRRELQLGKDTEHLPFDEDDIRFRNALQNLTEIFNLQIIVHYINAYGNPIIIRQHDTGIPVEVIRPINQTGRNIVHITQHGLYHFQYMVDNGIREGDNVVGAGDNGVLIGDKLYKDKKIKDVTNNTIMFKVYEEEIKKLNELKIKMNNDFTTQGVSPSLIQSYYDSFDDEIARINKEIERYKSIIISSTKKLEKNKDDFDPGVLQYVEEDFKAREQMRKNLG